MTTLSDLLSLPSKDDVLNTLAAFARLAGFPVASWQSGSVPRTLFEGEASTLADLHAAIMSVAKGGLLDSAIAEWLDLLGQSLFNERRKPAVFARHSLTLTAVAGAGPYTVTSGLYWVATADRSKRFVVVDLPNGPTVPMGGSLTVTVQAETPGAAWNVSPGVITEQVTPLLGVSVTNPAGSSGTSVVQQGVDTELDAAYAQRCRDKWGTLGSGSNDAAYRYVATTASDEVTRVDVYGDPATGIVTITVAGPSGPISSDGLALVTAAVASLKPLTVTVQVLNAVVDATPITATLYLEAGALAGSASQAAMDAANAYARTTAIGGTAYLSRIIAALQSATGVRSVAMTLPAADTLVARGHVVAFTFALGTVAP